MKQGDEKQITYLNPTEYGRDYNVRSTVEIFKQKRLIYKFEYNLFYF